MALLAFFTSLSTLASMAQQLHTYLRWTSIQLEQFDYVKANIDNPELSIAGASVGVDLVLFYIREFSPAALPSHSDSFADWAVEFYCYNAESILVASWYVVRTPDVSESLRHDDLLTCPTGVHNSHIRYFA